MVKIHLKKKKLLRIIWIVIVVVSSLALVGASLLPALNFFK